ncbi:hypothetical protein KMP13_02250 [Epibacterium ulvae]|uniref:hypothetical protein n=1 Tax=Epibacterium ulvae TaxID=1156985 RepID=UPI001BFC2733|nr:hypothetical protein [Epibacterium ulvae]MBT8152735.1 hypothetical protein [Epibacterium ulvae]
MQTDSQNVTTSLEATLELNRLRKQRADVAFNYENSAWGSGPAYRARLTEIDLEIAKLKRARG